MAGDWIKALALAMAVGAHGASRAAELTAGARLQPFALQDQRSQEHWVDQSTRLLLFSRDRDLSRMAFQVLDRKGGSFLADRHAVIILDISAMPRVITWSIAKPQMRRHAFPILLAADPKATRNIMTQNQKLTLVYLNRLDVEQIAFVSDPAGLERALQALRP